MQMRYKNIDSDLSCVTGPWLSAIRPRNLVLFYAIYKLCGPGRSGGASLSPGTFLFYIQFYDELLLIYLYNDEFMGAQNIEPFLN